MKRIVTITAFLAIIAGCAINSPEWAKMNHAERLAAVIQDARQTAAAIRWISPIAEVVVAGSCPECVAGYRAASATYQGLSILVDRAAFDASENPDDAEARQKLIDLTAEAKDAWFNLDAVYKGNPGTMAKLGGVQ